MNSIPHCEVNYHPHSFADPDGRLFKWNGQLYRGISSEWAPLLRKLLQDGVIHGLVGRGLLIDTESTDLAIGGYDMVVRHRCVPFASYPEEWCSAMFKDVVLTIVTLEIELEQLGLTLRDAHPWNVLFDACQPVYVDLTSMVPSQHESLWPAYNEFCHFCLYPLYLMSYGQERIARCLLSSYEGVRRSYLSMLAPTLGLLGFVPAAISDLTSGLRRRMLYLWQKLLNRVSSAKPPLFGSRLRSPKARLGLLEATRREVEGITLPASRPKWLSNSEALVLPLSRQETWTIRQQGLYTILTEIRPGSVLDVSNNTTWCARLAAWLGSRVVSFHTDENYVAQLYDEARARNLPILPLVMDFTNPTPSRGIASHRYIAAVERFQCEMVIALALVHELVFGRRLSFEKIVEGLALFSRRWLVIEFVPPQDEALDRWQSASVPWYTLDNLMSALRKWFYRIRMVPSCPGSRILLVCEKQTSMSDAGLSLEREQPDD